MKKYTQNKMDLFSGMRTHIRMHFDKKTNDFNEENYISCTLDEENTESQATILPSPTITTQALSPDNPLALAATSLTHHCEKCSYSSTFKGNLVCVYLSKEVRIFAILIK